MNNGLYNDWACKRMAAQNYQIHKILDRKRKRTNMMFKVVVPGSLIVVLVGAFTIAPYFAIVYMICCFLVAIGISTLMYLDDADSKKSMKILNAWSETTDPRLLPPSIRDTFN